MRIVKVRHIYGVGENAAPWENRNLKEFVFLAPDLKFSLVVFKVIPSFSALNDFFKLSKSEAGMSGGIEWKSFEIDKDEYNELVEELCTDPLREISIDEELNKIGIYDEWRKKAMRKYNPRKLLKS